MLTKSDIVDKVSKKTDVARVYVREFMKALEEVVLESAAQREPIQWVGLFSLNFKERQPHLFHNIVTGKTEMSHATISASMKPSLKLQEACKTGAIDDKETVTDEN